VVTIHATAVGVVSTVSSKKRITMETNGIIDRDFREVQQDIIRSIRHIAMRNNVTQEYVRVAMQTVLDNELITP
jgi:hypothetical protein